MSDEILGAGLYYCEWCGQIKNSDEIARGDLCKNCNITLANAYGILDNSDIKATIEKKIKNRTPR